MSDLKRQYHAGCRLSKALHTTVILAALMLVALSVTAIALI